MDKSIYYGYILKSDLQGEISYVKQFPEQIDLYNRFLAVFEQKQYASYNVDTELNDILLAYQQYYRNLSYFCIGKEQATLKKEAIRKL